MYTTTTGLVLRDSVYKESSRILTVLTDSMGKITVNARGAKRKGSKLMGATQHLACSEMTIFTEKGRHTLTEARPIELFEGLRDDLALYALGTYFSELLETLSNEDIPDPEILSLGLNCLYALSAGKTDPALVKAAFELRLMCISGFEPMLDGCVKCGKEPEVPAFSVQGGTLMCASCREGDYEARLIGRGTLAAMRHISGSEPKKLLSFSVGESTARELGSVCESFLIAQLGQDFRSLDYYKQVRQI